MRKAWAAVMAAALMAAAPAAGQAPPDGLVWMALRDINAEGFDPDDAAVAAFRPD